MQIQEGRGGDHIPVVANLKMYSNKDRMSTVHEQKKERGFFTTYSEV